MVMQMPMIYHQTIIIYINKNWITQYWCLISNSKTVHLQISKKQQSIAEIQILTITQVIISKWTQATKKYFK
jgi:hypothetical protein